MNILFVSVRRSVTAKPWTNHYTKYGKYVIYTCLKTRYRKAEGIMNKHALSFVNALCKSTHTLDQRYTTPRVTENDAPYLCVYVCVVCVGGARSNDNIVVCRTKTYSFPNEFPTRPPYEKTGVPHQYT